MGALFMGLGVAAVGAFGLAVKTAADFEKSLSNFQSATRVTEEDLEKIRQKALQIGRDTSFGAAQAAGAMVELGKAGQSVEEILAGTADATIALAEAGEVDLTRAAEVMVATLSQFRLGAEDAGRVADALVGAADASTASVESLAEGMKFAGPMAQAMGASVEEAAAALALFETNGINGGMAGTMFRSILTNLNPTTKRAQQSMEALGLYTEETGSAFYDAQGNFVGTEKAIGLLSDSMGDLTEEQRNAYTEAIFGQRAISGVNALVNEGAEGFREFYEAVEAGDAAETARIKLDNLAGAITILKGTIETALIAAGSPFQEVLKGIVQGVTSLINAFASLSPNVQKFIGIAVLAGGVLLILLGAFLMLLAAIGMAGGGFAIFMTTVLPAIGIFLAVVAAIALLGTALYLAWTRSETFRNIVISAFQTVKTAIETAMRRAQEIVTTVGEVIVRLWRQYGDRIISTVRTTFEMVRTVIVSVLSVIQAVVSGFIGVVMGFWNRFGDNILHLVRTVWDFIYRTIKNMLNIIIGVVQAFIALFTGDWEGLKRALLRIGKALWDQLTNVFNFAIQILINLVATLVDVVVGLWNSFYAAVRRVVTEAWNWIKQQFTQGVENVRTTARELPGRVVEAFSNLPEKMREAGKAAIQGLIQGIKDMASAVVDSAREIASNAADTVKSFFGVRSPSTLFMEIGEDLMKGLEVGILQNAGLISDAVAGVVGTTLDAAMGALNAFTGALGAVRGRGSAQDQLAAAEAEVARVRSRQRALPREIAAAERELEAARQAAAAVTLDEEANILRAQDRLRRAQESLTEAQSEGTLSAEALRLKEIEVTQAEQELARVRQEAVAPSSREVEEATRTLSALQEEHRGITDALTEAERRLEEAQLRVVDAEAKLLQSGAALIEQGPEGEAMFRGLADKAGLTKAAVDALIASYREMYGLIGGAAEQARGAVGQGSRAAIERAVRSVHGAGKVVDDADIRAALRKIGHNPGTTIDPGDLKVLLEKTGQTVNLNGDLVMPNVRDGQDAAKLLDNLRQAARSAT